VVDRDDPRRTLRVGFFGDPDSPNTRGWVDSLAKVPATEVIEFERPAQLGLRHVLRHRGRLLSRVRPLRDWLDEVQPDVLVAYRTTSYGFVAALTGFEPLIVAIQGETDVWPFDSPVLKLKAAAARLAMGRAALVHAWGSHMAAAAQELGVPETKILTLPRGIDIDAFPFSPRVGQSAPSRLIVTRSLYPEYRHEVLLKAVAILRAEGLELELRVLGDGSSREKLESLARELGLGSATTFTGQVPSEEIARELRSSNLYVSVPETEGVSASLLEAMASGCFPIVTDLPGNRDWVADGVNGFLVPVGDPGALAGALRRAVSDPALRAEAERLNRARVEASGSASRNAGVFVASYRRLAAERRRDAA
jgi:glycosyltransferase involved in cell wall biosynthesis